MYDMTGPKDLEEYVCKNSYTFIKIGKNMNWSRNKNTSLVPLSRIV